MMRFLKGTGGKHTQNNYEAADLLLMQQTPLANICSGENGWVSLVFLQCFKYWILQLYLRGTWFEAISIHRYLFKGLSCIKMQDFKASVSFVEMQTKAPFGNS